MKTTAHLVLFSFIIIFAACEKQSIEDNNNNNSNPNGNNIRIITDDIETQTTWYKDTVYVIDVYTLHVNSALTIQGGTVVKIKPENGINVLNGGSINANGTESKPIIFTAYTDDSYGGDTNGDGSSTIATKGFWSGIQLESVAVSTFSYCKFLYAGANNPNGAGENCAVEIESGSTNISFNHCTFAHTSGNGNSKFHCAIKICSSQLSDFIFENNIIYDNGGTVFLYEANLLGKISNTNIFHNPDNSSMKNVRQGIYVFDWSFNQNIELNVTEVPYIFDIVQGIDNGITLTLADHVIIKFPAGADFSYRSLDGGGIINYDGEGVLFTSIKDDTGGDSNGDGSLSTPANGDWVGIKDRFDGVDYYVFQNWNNIHYAEN